MTTANLMNVPSVKGSMASQIDASKKLQEENLEVAEMFAGLMNQTMEFSNTAMDDVASNTSVSLTSFDNNAFKNVDLPDFTSPTITIFKANDALVLFSMLAILSSNVLCE